MDEHNISWLVDEVKKNVRKTNFAFCRIGQMSMPGAAHQLKTIYCVSEFRPWEYHPTVLNVTSAADARLEKFKKAAKGLEADADAWILIDNSHPTRLENVYGHPNESFLKVSGTMSCVLTLIDDTPPGDVTGTLKTPTFESTLKLTLAFTPYQVGSFDSVGWTFFGYDSLGAGIFLQFL